MVISNTTGMLARKTGRNLAGEPTYATAVPVQCAVGDLMPKEAKTPIRNDASASRSASEEQEATALMLFAADTSIGQDDKFTIAGVDLRVMSVAPRFNVFGRIDHLSVFMGVWRV